MPAKKSKSSKSGPKTSGQTFDRRAAKAKTTMKQTIAGVTKSTRNKQESGKIKDTGKRVNSFGDERSNDIYPSSESRREAARQFSRVGVMAEQYFGDEFGIYGDAWPAWGASIVPRWGKWQEGRGPEYLGVGVARNPIFATQPQYDALREYYQKHQLDQRRQEQEERNYRRKVNKERMTKKK